MPRIFYNEEAFQKAVDYLETDPLRSVEMLEDYTNKYPRDYYGKIIYALALTRICNFNKAEYIYNIVAKNVANEQFYYSGQHKNIEGFKYFMLMVKVKILAWNNRYREILDLVTENYRDFQKTDYTYLEYYTRMKLGLLRLNEKELDNYPYRFRQAYRYDEELFRDHINKHVNEFNKNLAEPNEALFAEDFPIDKVIEEVKKNLPSDNRTFPGYFDDTYFFKYDDCGTVKNKETGVNEWTNYFIVVCFHGTTNIITMCPVINSGKILVNDLTSIKYETVKPDEQKVRKLSQIEKFNKRFNRK